MVKDTVVKRDPQAEAHNADGELSLGKRVSQESVKSLTFIRAQ